MHDSANSFLSSLTNREQKGWTDLLKTDPPEADATEA